MHARGLSRSLSREEAITWLGRAADQGHAAAARELAALEGGSVAAEAAAEQEEAAADEAADDAFDRI
jgi:hypothetical protein